MCQEIISFFFFNDTATTEIYTLSLHDALPISCIEAERLRVRAGTTARHHVDVVVDPEQVDRPDQEDRKSTRLNSSHANISYAVFCLKKKKIPISSISRFTHPFCSFHLVLVSCP